MLPDGSLDDEGRPPAGAALSNHCNVTDHRSPRVPDAGADRWAQMALAAIAAEGLTDGDHANLLDVLDELDERGAA